MCFFLGLEKVLIGGSSYSFSYSSSASVGELSVASLSPFSSSWSDYSVAFESASTYGSAVTSSSGSSVSMASSLTSTGAFVVLVSKLYC